MKQFYRRLFLIILTVCIFPGIVLSHENIIKMSTTTSTENSGLLDVLLPEFTKDTGIGVKVFAKGTGAAIRDGMDGNVDIIFVHDRQREEKFVSEGFGKYRLGVMHNDFVIIGPAGDPAEIKGTGNAAGALNKIAEKKAKFVSRGDDSGTHSKEQDLWKLSGMPLKTAVTDIVKEGSRTSLFYIYPDGMEERYSSIGQGMGKTITYAEEKQAYTLADRGTYLKYKFGRKQGLDLEILCEGDPSLFNPYGIIPVNPEKHSHVRYKEADMLAKWLVSDKAKKLISEYRIEGCQAFFPDSE